MNNFLVKTSGRDLAKDNSVKTLMLIHGWGMNSQVWEPIREALEAKYHVLWVDLPGHGFNRHIKAQSLERMVELVADITPENTNIIAWSLGGLVAQALAQEIPDKIRSLSLVTSTPRFSQDLSEDKSKHWQHAMSDEVLNRFAENLMQDTEKTLKGFIALQFMGVEGAKQELNNLINHILYNSNEKKGKKVGGVLAESELAVKSQETNIPSQEALDVGLEILKYADLRDITPTCPEHWVFAEYDRLIPKEVINDLISLRPDAEITLLKKSGHAPFITHRNVFLKSTIDFIESVT